MERRDITARLKILKGLFVRGAGFALAITIVCGALAVGSILRDPTRVPPQPTVAVIEQDEKDQTRVATGAPLPTEQVISAAADVSVWHSGKMENALLGESATAPRPAASAGRLPVELKEQEFSFVSVVDGRTFSSGGVTIRLAGVELPPADQVCRTLDNRLEQCVTRAATQLELLTRTRRLACRYRMTTSSEAIGSCRIGSHDLAERMVRTGYVRSADAGRTVMATMRGSVADGR